MKLLYFLPLLFLLLGCPNTPEEIPNSTPTNPNPPPNVLLIVTDDLGWYDLAAYGNPFIETPHLDRLASQGIRFTNGYAAAAICSPSRAGLLTGLHPVTVNITEHIHGNRPAPPGQPLRTPPIDQQLGLQYRTTGELMRDKGYATAYIGKWHLGGGQFHPENRGFQLTYGAGANGLPQSFFWPFFPPGQFTRLKQETKEGDYLTDVLTDKALSFISDHRDTAFFINLNYYAPHVPIMGKEELVEKYRQKRAANPNDSFPDPVYAAMVDAIDQNVGRLLDRLDSLDLAENTLVIFTSDNGGLSVREVPAFAAHTPPTDNGILRAGKGYLFEGGVRVPWIVRWPARVSAGQLLDYPVIGEDVYPTLADLPGMSPLLGNPPADRFQLWHAPHYTPQGGKPSSAIRQGEYKLVYDYETEQASLYNLSDDPGEHDDLSASQAAKTTELLTLLQQQLTALDARYPTPN